MNLRCWAVDSTPDIICVTESWTNSDHTDAFLRIDGYEISCRYDRKDTENGKGGGLLIYVKNCLSVAESHHPSYKEFTQ